ncbi:MAG: hypothetical protein WCJ64_12335 [Rhodospirillaceae bacterium]
MMRTGSKALALAALLALTAPQPGWALSPQAGTTIGIANTVVAQATQPGGDQPAGDQGGLSDNTKQGIGCLVAGGAALSYATFVAGATETLMIAAGGLLSPSSTPTLWLGLASTLTAATCALGAAATPAVLWAAEQKDAIAAHLAASVRDAGHEIAAAVMGASGPGGSRQLAERRPE